MYFSAVRQLQSPAPKTDVHRSCSRNPRLTYVERDSKLLCSHRRRQRILNQTENAVRTTRVGLFRTSISFQRIRDDWLMANETRVLSVQRCIHVDDDQIYGDERWITVLSERLIYFVLWWEGNCWTRSLGRFVRSNAIRSTSVDARSRRIATKRFRLSFWSVEELYLAVGLISYTRNRVEDEQWLLSDD